ncbi:MAG: tetratricopeptide repeat protein [Planctomycetes bacterium]|nr:tetratricopeptide repeat protein [Planctomycetota bacterium]
MDLSKHLEKAEDAIRRKNFDFGIDLYRQLLSVAPGDHDARAGLHRAYLRKQEAKPTPGWMAKVQGGPSIALARTLSAARNHAKSAEALENYLALDPMNLAINLQLGSALELANLSDGALAVYEIAAESITGAFEAWKRAGGILTKKREFGRAIECYTKALEINPRDQESLKARKDLAAEGALLTSGLETGGHARDLIKDKSQAADLERKQRVMQTAGEIGGEIDRLTGELANDPGNIQTLKDISKLYERKNDPDAALDCIERALQYLPDDFDLKTRRGGLKLRVLEREIERLRPGAAGDPVAGQTLARLEREKLAFEVEDARARVSEHPNDLMVRYKLGRVLLKFGDVDEAVGELQKSVADPRVKTDALVALGQAFFKKGLFDLARRQLEKALETVSASSPRTKEILYNLGVIGEKTNNAHDALGFYLRIYEIDISYRDVADKVKKLQGA